MIRLSDFDSEIIKEYDISSRKLDRIWHYVRLIQGPETPTLRDIALGGYYGTSALLHEIVELDILLARDPRLLRRSRQAILAFYFANEDVHAKALAAEYGYLHQIIYRLFAQQLPLGALVYANASGHDFEVLLESDAQEPLFLPDEEQIETAARWLARLRALGKEMPK